MGKIGQQLNFYVINDSGRNGYYKQKQIATTMGKISETIDIKFIIAAGDIHHFEGVRSISDPLWITNYELIYGHPGLMIPWYPICGNHEYHGNTQAVLDYSLVSSRWSMPAKYYTFTASKKDVTVRILMLDTTPLIDKYRKDSTDYPDVSNQNSTEQLEWIYSVLTVAHEDWIIAVGHHPIYADTIKNESERKDMQDRVNQIFLKHGNVDMYICGHIHNFQHIHKNNYDIDYVVNSSGALSREVSSTDGTIFCSSEEGFSLLTIGKNEMSLYMINSKGRILHKICRKRI